MREKPWRLLRGSFRGHSVGAWGRAWTGGASGLAESRGTHRGGGAAGGLANLAGVAAAYGWRVGERVVGELPLVVVLLFLVNEDRGLIAGGREANDACAAEGWSAGA